MSFVIRLDFVYYIICLINILIDGELFSKILVIFIYTMHFGYFSYF